MICPKCGLPMRHYKVAGHEWDKCLSPYCGYTITEKEMAWKAKEVLK